MQLLLFHALAALSLALGEPVSKSSQCAIEHDGRAVLRGNTSTTTQPSSLQQVLDYEANRVLNEVVPRAFSESCKERLRDQAHHIRTSFERTFPRHAAAELFCPIDDVAGQRDGSQQHWESFIHSLDDREPVSQPRLVDSDGNPRCDAVIAFAIQLSNKDSTLQLDRLLRAILRPNHIYHFSIDAQPDTTTPGGASLNQLFVEKIETIINRYGPVKYYTFRTNIDVIYTGQSLLSAYLFAWKDLLEPQVPAWDFIINISGADYPIKSVEFMSRALAYQGAVSHTESFLQIPKWSNGRALRSWFFECPDETCGDHNPPQSVPPFNYERGLDSDDPLPDLPQPKVTADSDSNKKCSGYVFWLPSKRKPPMAESREFGGSAFWVLHQDFVRYTWRCLVGDEQDMDEADAAYCPSIRGMYKWFSTSFSPEETFVQTALYNGPFCSRTKGGNMRFVAWNMGDRRCGSGSKEYTHSSYNQNDYKSRRPGCITVTTSTKFFPPKLCGPNCQSSNIQLFARKFSMHHHREAFDRADEAAKMWDLKSGITRMFKCGDEGDQVATDKPARKRGNNVFTRLYYGV